ncbi:hypothetical protein [Sphingomonas sp. DBB INV C78]|uniref:hypothetical protein n=1 Tax=Sphingomonas sp. DBB INV C78 TaxID=3349434 RepID=UPI0036D2C3A2
MWAFLVAPFPAALFQSIVVALWPKEGMGVFKHPSSMFVAVCIYYYFSGLLLGLPAWLVMRKRNVVGLRGLAIAGLIVGLLPVAVALGWTVVKEGASAYVVTYNLLFFGLGGMAAGWVYWLVALRNRGAIAPTQAKV